MSSFLPHSIAGRRKKDGDLPCAPAVPRSTRPIAGFKTPAATAQIASSATPAAASSSLAVAKTKTHYPLAGASKLKTTTDATPATTTAKAASTVEATPTPIAPSARTALKIPLGSTTTSISSTTTLGQAKVVPSYMRPRQKNSGFGNFRRNQSRLKGNEDEHGLGDTSSSAIFQAAERFSQEMQAIGDAFKGYASRRKALNEVCKEKKSLYVQKMDREKTKSTVKEYIDTDHARPDTLADDPREADCARELEIFRRDLDSFVENAKACASHQEFGASKKSENFLFSVWASEVGVGDLWSPCACSVNCFDDRIEYKVAKHPEEGLVYMFMSFKHLLEPAFDHGDRKLSFRLPKTLRWFAKYYKPETRTDHKLWIKFQTEADATKFREEVFGTFISK
ncbi:unnamed protein product [Amoebophrya sp. A25]|nr:unnamed protein product [Amoebophrya sp. A25]|eukprot:GSA25T00012397001.1